MQFFFEKEMFTEQGDRFFHTHAPQVIWGQVTPDKPLIQECPLSTLKSARTHTHNTERPCYKVIFRHRASPQGKCYKILWKNAELTPLGAPQALLENPGYCFLKAVLLKEKTHD